MLPPNAGLFEFLSSHGISLADFGSAERGLSAEHAISFVRMLQAHGFSPVGIEVWRRKGNAWRIDSTGGWFGDELDPEELCRTQSYFSAKWMPLKALLLLFSFEPTCLAAIGPVMQKSG